MKSIKQISPDIRLVASPEQESYESVYGVEEDEEYRAALAAEIEAGGLWHVASEYRCPCCGSWVHADSIGMIIGDPFEESNNCYIPDLVAQAKSDLQSKTVHAH